jgi:hypothetical protein
MAARCSLFSWAVADARVPCGLVATGRHDMMGAAHCWLSCAHLLSWAHRVRCACLSARSSRALVQVQVLQAVLVPQSIIFRRDF